MSQLEDYAKSIMQSGPSRVVINSDQEAVSCRRAREQHGINPDIIFIRNDGWSLGAPKRLAAYAFGTWSDCWIGYIERPSTEPKPISEYQLG